ncbi:MAG: hypothetical protein ACRCX2_31455 [Paraclostridium sp.]
MKDFRDSDNSEKWFENYYKCVRCGKKWVVDGDSMHEDDCPECGKTMIPYNSIEIE